MDISFNNNIHENIMYYHRNIRDYTDNLHEYNQNMRNYLALLMTYHVSNQYTTQPAASNLPRRPIRQSNRNNLNSLLNNYLNRNNRQHHYEAVTNQIYNLDSVLFEPVVVRPNNEHINNAIEHIQFTDRLSQNTCPITLETFQEGEQICRIIHCGHIFKEIALNQWFQRNVRCPVCRYDIRDYVRPHEQDQDQNQDQEQEQDQNQDQEQDQTDNINEESEFDDVIRELNEELNEELNNTRRNSSRTSQPSSQPTSSSNTRYNTRSSSRSTSTPLTSMLVNSIRAFINNELQQIPTNSSFNELIYTFDIPIDISGNNYQI